MNLVIIIIFDDLGRVVHFYLKYKNKKKNKEILKFLIPNQYIIIIIKENGKVRILRAKELKM